MHRDIYNHAEKNASKAAATSRSVLPSMLHGRDQIRKRPMSNSVFHYFAHSAGQLDWIRAIYVCEYD